MLEIVKSASTHLCEVIEAARCGASPVACAPRLGAKRARACHSSTAVVCRARMAQAALVDDTDMKLELKPIIEKDFAPLPIVVNALFEKVLLGEGHQPTLQFGYRKGVYYRWLPYLSPGVEALRPSVFAKMERTGQSRFLDRFAVHSDPAGLSLQGLRTRDCSGRNTRAGRLTLLRILPPCAQIEGSFHPPSVAGGAITGGG